MSEATNAMPNDIKWPLPEFHFKVEISNQVIIDCKEVFGLNAGYDEFGNSDFENLFEFPQRRKIVLEKIISKDAKELKNWIDHTKPQTISIMMLDESNSLVMCWQAINARPIKIIGENYDVAGNCISMETLILFHEGIVAQNSLLHTEELNTFASLHDSSLLGRENRPELTAHGDAVQKENIEIHNAGLCLITPFVPRLFHVLGLTIPDRKDFKDMESRIRAIFILQRLVTYEDRTYDESHLAFNRVLTNCPFDIPLPRKLALTENEIQFIESLLNSTKINWYKMRATSISAIQNAFIERKGRLEQLEDKWMLSVEYRAYDILLDSMPWSYSIIRFPWQKKTIYVNWNNN